MSQLPPEICVKVAHFTGFVPDLLALSRVCKAFQSAAQAKLYEAIIVRDPQTAYSVCKSINAKNSHLGALVRRFWMFQDPRRMRSPQSPIPRYIWEEVRLALEKMKNLDLLHIQDPTTSNSWVLPSISPEFQLLEANIGFTWDVNVVAFLQTQKRLTFLSSLDSAEDGPPCPVPSGALQSLESYHGSILIANELLGSPLVHLQVLLDEELTPLMPNILSDLGSIKKTLRSLSLLHLPEDMVLETLQLISKSAFVTNLRYLGLFPLPVLDRHDVHGCLIRCSSLQVLHIDISRWDPFPADAFQRMLATELRTFCPTLCSISFWARQYQFLWCYHDDSYEWRHVHSSPRIPQNDTTWRTV